MKSIHYADMSRAERATVALRQNGYDAELLPNLQTDTEIFHLLKLNPENEQDALDHLREHDLLSDLDEN